MLGTKWPKPLGLKSRPLYILYVSKSNANYLVSSLIYNKDSQSYIYYYFYISDILPTLLNFNAGAGLSLVGLSFTILLINSYFFKSGILFVNSTKSLGNLLIK